MSQAFDPENPEQTGGTHSGGNPSGGYGQSSPYGYNSPAGGSFYPGGPGYGEPPMPPRRSHKRGLIATGVVALAAGAALGGLVGSMDHSVAGTATATSKTVLTSSQIAARVDPGLVDVVSTDGLQQATSEGTGIVLTSTGEVLTNNHVIEGATSVKAIDIGNGKTYTAKVVGYDATQDVAVIQLQSASGLTTATLGDSATVQAGASVTALGNAEGKGGTPAVATGTVTALNQSITASDELSSASEQLTGLIETNAPIQPGDSGGPLVNSYGQVIGMDTAASSSYELQGQSSTATQAYAIPVDQALSIAKDIEAGTTTSDIHIGATAFLGIEIGSSSSSSGDGSGSSGSGGFGSGSSGSGSNGSGSFGGFGGFGGQSSEGGTSDTNGVTISGTVSGSPAANAGITEGDTITAVGGTSVTAAEDVSNALVKYHPGDSITITYQNADGQSQTSTLTLASGPAA
jgi:S1-C subfamily serine protease